MTCYESDFDYGPLFEFEFPNPCRTDSHEGPGDFTDGLTSDLWPSISTADTSRLPDYLSPSSSRYPIPAPTTLLSLSADHVTPPTHDVADLPGMYELYLTPPNSLSSITTPTHGPPSSSVLEDTPLSTTGTAVLLDPTVWGNQAGTATNIRALILEYCKQQRLPLISEGPGMNLFPITMMGASVALQKLAPLDNRGPDDMGNFQLNGTPIKVTNPTSESLSAIQPGLFLSKSLNQLDGGPPVQLTTKFVDGYIRPMTPSYSNSTETRSGFSGLINELQPISIENPRKRKRNTEKTDENQRKKSEHQQPNNAEHSTDRKAGVEIPSALTRDLYKQIPCKWDLSQADTTLSGSDIVTTEGCGKLLPENITAFELREHLRLHHALAKMEQKGKTRCLWKGCTRVPKQFTRHILSHIKKEICPGCKKRFANAFSLQRHLTTETFANCLQRPSL